MRRFRRARSLLPLGGMTWSVAICLAAALSWTTRPPWIPQQPAASEQRPPVSGSRYLERPLVLEGILSVGSPYGLLGVALDYSPSRHLALSAGTGLGRAGMQLAFMPRLRFPAGEDLAISFGAGYSGGPYEAQSCGLICFMEAGTTYTWSFAHWANFELNLEGRTEGGMQWRVFLGREFMLNPDDHTSDDPNGRGLGPGVDELEPFTFGFALGHAF